MPHGTVSAPAGTAFPGAFPEFTIPDSIHGCFVDVTYGRVLPVLNAKAGEDITVGQNEAQIVPDTAPCVGGGVVDSLCDFID